MDSTTTGAGAREMIVPEAAGRDAPRVDPAGTAKPELWRPIRTLIGGAFVLVPAHVFVMAGGLVLAAGMATDRLPEGVLAAIGAWSLRFTLGAFGAVAGVVAGLAGAAKRLVDGFEDVLRGRIMAMAAKDDGRLFPAVATSEARSRYEGVLDRLVDEMLGRIRVPRFIRGLIRRGLEQSLVEEFLADCERRGIANIGVTEVRNWAIATGLPRALAPVRGQIAIWRIISIGPAALVFTLLVLVSLIGTAVSPLTVLAGVCGLVGVATFAAGWVGARTHRRPARWRLGLTMVGLSVAAWPWVWPRLLSVGPGTAWIGSAVMLLVIVQGLRIAFVSADRPTGVPAGG